MRHHDYSNSYIGKHLIGVAYIFRGLVHYHVGHGDVQADMVLEKQLEVLHLDSQATGSGLRYWVWLDHIWDKAWFHSDILPPTRVHLLLVRLPLWAIFFLSTTWYNRVLLSQWKQVPCVVSADHVTPTHEIVPSKPVFSLFSFTCICRHNLGRI